MKILINKRESWSSGFMVRIGLCSLMISIAVGAQADSDAAIDESSSPNILYVVPWVEVADKRVKTPKLVVHNLMDDLYEPVVEGAQDWTAAPLAQTTEAGASD